MPSLTDWDNWTRTTIAEFNKRLAMQAQMVPPVTQAIAPTGQGMPTNIPVNASMHFQNGGVVPGQGMGDNVDIKATPGEIVIPNNIGEMKIKDLMLGVISLNKAQDTTLQSNQEPIQRMQYGGKVLTEEEQQAIKNSMGIPSYAQEGGKTMPIYNPGWDNTPIQNTPATAGAIVNPEVTRLGVQKRAGAGDIFTNTDLQNQYGGALTSPLTDEQNLAIIAQNRADKEKYITSIGADRVAMNEAVGRMTPEQQHTYYLQKSQDERANDPNIQLADIKSNIQYRESKLEDLEKHRAFESFSNDSFVMQNKIGKLRKHLESSPNDKVAQAAYESNQQALSELKKDYAGLIGKPQTLETARLQEERLGAIQGRERDIAERKQAIEEGMFPTEKKLKESQAEWYSGRGTQAEALADKAQAEATLMKEGKFKLPAEEANYQAYEKEQLGLGNQPLERVDWYIKRHQANIQGNPLYETLNRIANEKGGGVIPIPSATPQQGYPEGKRLIGNDGKIYIVKGGIPVPEGG